MSTPAEAAWRAQAVEFHTGVAEPVDFACRLLRKAYRNGARVAVFGPADMLQRLDAMLWQFGSTPDFIPHARCEQPHSATAVPATLRRAPIHLMTAADVAPLLQDVALNLGDEAISRWSRCARVIELIGAAPDAVQAGRRRWKAYQAQGLQVVHHPAAA